MGEKKEITDIKDIRIDMSMPKEKRIVAYVRQSGNPYCIRVGSVIVEMAFSSNGETMQRRILGTSAQRGME